MFRGRLRRCEFDTKKNVTRLFSFNYIIRNYIGSARRKWQLASSLSPSSRFPRSDCALERRLKTIFICFASPYASCKMETVKAADGRSTEIDAFPFAGASETRAFRLIILSVIAWRTNDISLYCEKGTPTSGTLLNCSFICRSFPLTCARRRSASLASVLRECSRGS